MNIDWKPTMCQAPWYEQKIKGGKSKAWPLTLRSVEPSRERQMAEEMRKSLWHVVLAVFSSFHQVPTFRKKATTETFAPDILEITAILAGNPATLLCQSVKNSSKNIKMHLPWHCYFLNTFQVCSAKHSPHNIPIHPTPNPERRLFYWPFSF